ncbi:MAG: hypothetical protein QOE11_3078 [Solirubrobacteraceae bacterium]|jgi:hypothetical protein|nr:hypothetical protein [Solirubrobacteraceae bacterium]
MIDRVLTPLRTALRELVERRLWPIAVVLLVALVAVPVVIRSSPGDAAAPAAAVTPAAPRGTESAITVVEPAEAGPSRPGAVRDPIYAPAKPKDSTTTTTTVTSSAPSPSSSSSPSSGAVAPASPATAGPKPAATGSGDATAPSPTPDSKPAASTTDAPVVYRTHVRWGADDQAAVRSLSRLQPLGGLSDPALLYLGTTRHGARALFLLGPDAIADVRDGECAENTCRVISLKAGRSIAIGVVGREGAASRSYDLVVDAVVAQPAADESTALELRGRVHHDGRDALRAMIRDPRTAAAIGQFRFDRSLGAVVAIDAP